MELEEMKNIWGAVEGEKKRISYQINKTSRLEFKRIVSTYKTAEITGLMVAYSLAGLILYQFNTLSDWYLRWCGGALVVYLLIMPLYTLFQTWKVNHIDLAHTSYKALLERFHTMKRKLKKAEIVSLAVSPFLFFASIMMLSKMLTNRNLFALDIQMPAILFIIGAACLSAFIFNVWAFKKRDKQFKSVEQLLEEDIDINTKLL